ncbi:MFS transporter [Neobacillus niacini]|uniref:MFS transporter n=1 Tax=Neobacillus niacini TaxID=86668 RepID=UPI002FFFCDA9
MRNPFFRMASSLYINYMLLGMMNIILVSNMSFLSKQFSTDSLGISLLISAIGIGKLITLSFSGRLSDRIGRKPLAVTASFLNVIFLVGIPLAPNYQLAFVFAVIAGISNSILDSGAFPALIEAYPNNSGSATVLVKAFISVGAAFLPIMISFFISHDLFYGFSFFVPAAIYFINGMVLLSIPFPNHKASKSKNYLKEYSSKSRRFFIQPKLWREGLGIMLIGFTSVALLMVIQVWLPTYGQEIAGLSQTEGVGLLSFYNIGGFISVLLLAVLLKKVIKTITVLIIYPSIALVSLLFLIAFPNPITMVVCSFLLGLSTSGIFQLAVALMTEFFPDRKGTSSAYVSMASSTAFIVIPFLTGLLTKYFSVTSVFVFDIGVAIVSILLAINISIQYKKVFNLHSKSGIMRKAFRLLE